MTLRTRFVAARAFAALLLPGLFAVTAAIAQSAGAGGAAAAVPAGERAAAATLPAAAPAVNGRIEDHDGLRIVRVWGSPEQRGTAHGVLLGREIAATMRAEFTARFGRRPGLLQIARQSLPRLIAWPDDVDAELAALFAGVQQSGADLSVPALERALDLDDLRVANALDVFGLMGCSGFTVWGDEVDGGGVLCGRNFDWPFTGPHMLDSVILLVQHPDRGAAFASVAWPGYVAVVTGVNEDGVACFLHVGTGKITLSPEPESWPIAICARTILQRGRAAAGAGVFATAADLLEYSSPPAGMLARVVLPAVPEGESPVGVFECDSRKVQRATIDRCEVVTNHFLSRTDGRPASFDSTSRAKSIRGDLETWLQTDDKRVSVEEAWRALAKVQRGGSHAFGTLHSLVFRAAPWHFELRLAKVGADGRLVAAPQAGRAFVLDRATLFPAVVR